MQTGSPLVDELPLGVAEYKQKLDEVAAFWKEQAEARADERDRLKEAYDELVDSVVIAERQHRELVAQRDRLRAVVETLTDGYVDHRDGCAVYADYPCDCGLDDVFRQLDVSAGDPEPPVLRRLQELGQEAAERATPAEAAVRRALDRVIAEVGLEPLRIYLTAVQADQREDPETSDLFWHCRCGARYHIDYRICPSCGAPRKFADEASSEDGGDAYMGTVSGYQDTYLDEPAMGITPDAPGFVHDREMTRRMATEDPPAGGAPTRQDGECQGSEGEGVQGPVDAPAEVVANPPAGDGPPVCPDCGTPRTLKRKWNSGNPADIWMDECDCADRRTKAELDRRDESR
jgi:hypothetical protein